MTDCERCCICGKIDGEDLRVQPGKVIIAGYCEEHDPSAELAKLRALCRGYGICPDCGAYSHYCRCTGNLSGSITGKISDPKFSKPDLSPTAYGESTRAHDKMNAGQGEENT